MLIYWIIFVPVFMSISIGIYKKYEHIKKKKLYKEITGTVVDSKKVSRKPSIHGISIIRYEVGKVYYVFEYYGPYIKLGTNVEIMYNPNRPDEAIKKKDSLYIFYLLGGVLLCLVELALLTLVNI